MISGTKPGKKKEEEAVQEGGGRKAEIRYVWEKCVLKLWHSRTILGKLWCLALKEMTPIPRVQWRLGSVRQLGSPNVDLGLCILYVSLCSEANEIKNQSAAVCKREKKNLFVSVEVC